MNPLTANPVIVLQDAYASRSRGDRRGHRKGAVAAARAARRALERVSR